jgi:hypothetical protein
MQRTLHVLDELRHVVERKPGRSLPRLRALTLKALRRGARRVANPLRNVSFTTSLNGLPARRDSALSLAATSSSRVRVVRMS